MYNKYELRFIEIIKEALYINPSSCSQINKLCKFDDGGSKSGYVTSKILNLLNYDILKKNIKVYNNINNNNILKDDIFDELNVKYDIFKSKQSVNDFKKQVYNKSQTLIVEIANRIIELMKQDKFNGCNVLLSEKLLPNIDNVGPLHKNKIIWKMLNMLETQNIIEVDIKIKNITFYKIKEDKQFKPGYFSGTKMQRFEYDSAVIETLNSIDVFYIINKKINDIMYDIYLPEYECAINIKSIDFYKSTRYGRITQECANEIFKNNVLDLNLKTACAEKNGICLLNIDCQKKYSIAYIRLMIFNYFKSQFSNESELIENITNYEDIV